MKNKEENKAVEGESMNCAWKNTYVKNVKQIKNPKMKNVRIVNIKDSFSFIPALL